MFWFVSSCNDNARMQQDTYVKHLLQQEGGGTSDVENEASGWDESEPEVIACDSAEAAPHPAPNAVHTVSSCEWHNFNLFNTGTLY
jgi:hypothetical protein